MSDDQTRPASGADEQHGSAPVPPVPPVPPVASGSSGAAPVDSPPPVYGTPTPPPPPSAYASAPGYPPAPSAASAPGYAAPGYAAPAVPRTLSLVGMILGIIGLVITLFAWGFGFVLSAPAVVLGFLGRRREPGARGFALTAIVTGLAGIVVALIYLALTIVLFTVALSGASSS